MTQLPLFDEAEPLIRCVACERHKPSADFYRLKGGYHPECRACSGKRRRVYHATGTSAGLFRPRVAPAKSWEFTYEK